MRRHAKASSVGSNSGKVARGRLLLVAALTLLASLALGVSLATAVAPTVTIEDAEEVEYTSAKVKGTVDPGDQFTEYHFEAATEADFSNVSAFAGSGSLAENEGVKPVEAEFNPDNFNGLNPGTTYHVRLVASNLDGPAEAVAASTFTTKAVPAPDVTINPVTSVTGTSAHFEGTIDPNAPEVNPGEFPEEFDVEYWFECTPGCPGLGKQQSAETLEADDSVHTVQADPTGLDSNTDYEVKLVASNAGGTAEAGSGFKTLAVAVEAISLPVGPVTETTAIIGGWVDPNGSPTTYYVEWASEADFSDAVSIPVSEDASAGSGQAHVPVSNVIAGLAPDTDYFYRLSADNGVGVDASEVQSFHTLVPEPQQSCSNEQFRVGPSAGLPDCRAFEKVTPGDKNGGGAEPGAILDADRTALRSTAAFLPNEAFFKGSGRYLSARTASGWQLRPSYIASNSYVGDLNSSGTQDIILQQDCTLSCPPLLPSDTDTGTDIYRRDSSGIHLVSLGSEGGNSGETASYVGQSNDGEHIIFETTERLEPADAGRASGRQIYEWSNGEVRVVGVDSNGDLVSDGGAVLGDGLGFQPGPAGASNAISADGEVIFFESPDPAYDNNGFTSVNHQLYARIASSETLHISASQCSPACTEPSAPATFQGAAEDGSVVYFTTAAQLLNEDVDSAVDLYRYRISDSQLELVTDSCVAKDDSTVDCGWPYAVFSGKPGGVIGVSGDGSRIYIASPPGVATLDGPATESSIWLYDSHTESTTFVAPAPDDFLLVDRRLNLASASAQITPDGGTLIFASQHRLTAFDNRCAENLSAKCVEIYRYQASSNETRCVSCNTQGTLPLEHAVNTLDRLRGSESLSEVHAARDPNPLMANEGQTIVFQTADALLPVDTNERVDVYEWHAGHLYLISTGQSAVDSKIGGISRDGRSIFFSTDEALLPIDLDTAADLYTARVAGGFPLDQGGGSVCNGDGCRGRVPAPHPDVHPNSRSFTGPTNLTPKGSRCAVKKVRRGGKCVKRDRKRRRGSKQHRGSEKASKASAGVEGRLSALESAR